MYSDYMDWRNMAMKAEGMHTIDSFSSSMNIQVNTAVTYIHELRDRGFVKTMHGRKGKRVYRISPLRLKKVGSRGFIGVINKNSSLKIQKPFERRVYGREISIEEAIIEAIKTGNSRIILASVELFKKVRDWSLLYRLAKENGSERHVGALYDLGRKYFRIRRIDGRILRRMNESPVRNIYIIAKRGSDDFKDIEKKWKIRIPFNKSDMERLVM